MIRNNWIWLDMDGTFVDFYGVNGWLDDLVAFNPRPYRVAKSLYNDLDLLSILLDLKGIGYNIGVVSWSSKANNPAFDIIVEENKKEWLIERGYDLVLDKIIVAPYGMCKADLCKSYGVGVLVDDEEQNRKNWYLGETINAECNIITELKKLLYR